MTNRVWKFPLALPGADGRSRIEMPVGSEILSVGMQADTMVVWAVVEPSAPLMWQTFIVGNTGPELPSLKGAKFIGTVTSSNGIVWHVWAA